MINKIEDLLDSCKIKELIDNDELIILIEAEVSIDFISGFVYGTESLFKTFDVFQFYLVEKEQKHYLIISNTHAGDGDIYLLRDPDIFENLNEIFETFEEDSY